MKKRIFILAIGALLAAVSCNPETEYSAASDRYQVTDLKATAGDAEVLLEWTMKEGWSPEEYLVSYNDAAGNAVQEYTGSTETCYTVAELDNGVNYVFSVQAVYSGGRLSGIEKVSASPVNSRVPVENLKLEASDSRIAASWTLPSGAECLSIKFECSSKDETVKSVELEASARSCEVTGLVNFKEYEVSVSPVYAKGPAVAVSAKATPIGGDPLCHVAYEEVYCGQLNTFTFNTASYPGATDISWTFDDGKVLSGAQVEYRIWGTEKAGIVLKANINDSQVEYKFYVSIREFAVNFDGWSKSGVKFKNSHFAFSPDRKTAYTLSYSSYRYLVAIELATGKLKWEYNLGGGEGNGAHFGVNPVTGDVVVSSNTTLYSIKEDGTVRWSLADCYTAGVGAAFSPDASTIYVGTTSKQLKIVNASDGTLLSTSTFAGNVASIVVDGTTLIITLRVNADGNLQFLDVSNPASVKVLKSCKFDSRGSDICSASVGPDKKTMYFSADQNFYCVDLESREITASVHTSDESNYLVCGSVVDPSGNVCFVYAATSSQSYMALYSAGLASKKWDWYPESHKNTFNYNCPVVDSDGNFYVADRTGKAWQVSAGGTSECIFTGPQALQGATGMCDNIVLTAGNAAPGVVVGKCVQASRASGWSGSGGDPCCTKCIQWVYK